MQRYAKIKTYYIKTPLLLNITNKTTSSDSGAAPIFSDPELSLAILQNLRESTIRMESWTKNPDFETRGSCRPILVSQTKELGPEDAFKLNNVILHDYRTL